MDTEIIVRFIRFNPNLNLATKNKNQTPYDIVKKKHKVREDLLYFLNPTPLTISQVLRVLKYNQSSQLEGFGGSFILFDALTPFFEFNRYPKKTDKLNKIILSALSALVMQAIKVLNLLLTPYQANWMEASFQGKRFCYQKSKVSLKLGNIYLTQTFAWCQIFSNLSQNNGD